MGDLKGSNWSDGQWFNFLCGIITSQHLVPIDKVNPTPTPDYDTGLDHVYIRDIMEIEIV